MKHIILQISQHSTKIFCDFFSINNLHTLQATQKTNKNITQNVVNKTEKYKQWTLCAISKYNKVIKRQNTL